MLTRSKVFQSVRARIADNSGVIFPDADLITFFDDAVMLYNAHRPIVKRGVVTTVVGTQTYTAVTGTVNVVKAWFSPTQSFYRDFYNDPWPNELDEPWNDLDGVSGDADLLLEWGATGDILYLSPSPTSTGTINYLYTVDHAVDASGNYPSIPTTDHNIFVNWVLARMYDSMSVELQKQGSIQTGDSRMDPAQSIKAFRDQATSHANLALSRLEEHAVGMRG